MTTQTAELLPCAGCGMVPLRNREYHPYAACLMYRASKDANVVRTNLQAILDEGEMVEWVERFYGEYYFRPKAAFRVVWKAVVNRDVPRLYVEAKSFMKLRSQRNKASRKMKEENALKAQESVSMNA